MGAVPDGSAAVREGLFASLIFRVKFFYKLLTDGLNYVLLQ